MSLRKKYQLWYGRTLILGLALILGVAAPATAKTIIGQNSGYLQAADLSAASAEPTALDTATPMQPPSPTAAASTLLAAATVAPADSPLPLSPPIQPSAAEPSLAPIIPTGTLTSAETPQALPDVTSIQELASPAGATSAAAGLNDPLMSTPTVDVISFPTILPEGTSVSTSVPSETLLPADTQATDIIPVSIITPTSEPAPTALPTSLLEPSHVAVEATELGSSATPDIEGTQPATSTATLTPSLVLTSTPTTSELPTPTATATLTSTDISTINTSAAEGRLEFSADVELAVAVRLNGQDQAVAGSFPIIVTDTRLLRSGWKLMITMTQFRLNGANNHSLTRSVATISDVDIVCNQSGCIPPQNVINYPLNVFDQATPLTFFVAESGSGLGSFTVTPYFQLHVPANVYAGHYTAAIQLTIVDGP